MSKLALVVDKPLEDQTKTAPHDSILPLVLDDACFDVNGHRLLDRISLTLCHGVRTVILGPNGAGKSLLLRLCHGLLQPTAGRMHWSDNDSRRLHKKQAMVFQRPVLLRRSVAANVTYALAVKGVSRDRRRSMVARALEEVGLAHLAQRPARVLSSGEQQRLALARARALEPEVLFLDEPTANLDPGATRLIEETINAFHRQGAKIVLVTHDLGQARRHADEIVFLHRGRLVERSMAASFFKQPRSDEAKAFLAGELLD